MHTENSIIINGSMDDVFDVMTDVKRWPQFLSSHKKMDFDYLENGKIMVRRHGIIKWESVITIDQTNKSMKSNQCNGPLKGLIAVWKFEEQEGHKTTMWLFHEFYLNLPLIGILIEALVSVILRRISNNTLKAVKKEVEKRK